MKRSYEATEDNEISFREGDRIVEIEAVSDDWWQGKSLSGQIGLFPGVFFSRLMIEIGLLISRYSELCRS